MRVSDLYLSFSLSFSIRSTTAVLSLSLALFKYLFLSNIAVARYLKIHTKYPTQQTESKQQINRSTSGAVSANSAEVNEEKKIININIDINIIFFVYISTWVDRI